MNTSISRRRTGLGETIFGGESETGFGIRMLRAALLVVAGLVVYSPAFHGAFFWDDDRIIASNVQVHDPAGFTRIWTKSESDGLGYYYPLELTVQWIQWQLWGPDTLGYHLTNVALHLVGAFLVWRLFEKLGLRGAWLGAMIFTVHPIMVESVAWISELKNTLSLPPLLMAILAYLTFEERRRRQDYALAVGWFFVSMLCKTSGVMLPILFLLHAWWKRGRISRTDVLACVPFLLVSLVLGLVTVNATGQMQDYASTVASPGWIAGLVSVGLTVLFLLGHFVFPIGLLPLYPALPTGPVTWIDFAPWLLLTGLFGWFWSQRASWGRHALFGCGFFLINLAPILWFVFKNHASMVWTMDHNTYVPVIGLIGLEAAAATAIYKALSPSIRGLATLAVTLALLAWASGTYVYAGKFRTPLALWAYVIQRHPDSALAHNYIALIDTQNGRIPEALLSFETSLHLAKAQNQDTTVIENNLGNVLCMAGRYQEGQAYFEHGLKLHPDYAQGHFNLGNVLLISGRTADAETQFRQAIAWKPGYFKAHVALGRLLLGTHRVPEAMAEFDEALRIDPNQAGIHVIMAQVLEQSGHEPEAVAHYQAALDLDPGNRDARAGLQRLRGDGGGSAR